MKKKIKISLLGLILLLTHAPTLWAQSTTAELRKAVIAGKKDTDNYWTAYKGKIGEDRTIYVLLNMNYDTHKDGQQVIGEYFYRQYGIPIKLKGSIEKDRLVLKEYAKGQHTGTMNFTLEWSELEGKWTSPKGKSYKIQLSEMGLAFYVQNFYYKQHYRISNKDFKAFVNLFSPVYTPSNLEHGVESEELSDDWVVRYLEPGFEEKKAEFELMYYKYRRQAVSFREHFILLTTIEEHSPGVAGVHGTDYRIHTFTYDGQPIDMVNVGCECVDIDMGINEDHVTFLTVIMDWNKFGVYKHYLHNREGEPIDQITSVDYYTIDLKGRIKEVP